MNQTFNLTLNRYQRDNLNQLLRLIMNCFGPLAGANTGDWVGEIRWMLDPKHPGENGHPNLSDEQFLQNCQSKFIDPNMAMKKIIL